MAARTPDSATASSISSAAQWTDDGETPPTHRILSHIDSFGYTDSRTPKVPLVFPESTRALAAAKESPAAHHLARFLNDSELLLAADPRRTRESFRELEEDAESVHWHELPLDRALEQLKVDPRAGLPDYEVQKRLTEVGANSLQRDKRAPVWVLFLLQFCNLIIALLMAAAVASIALQEFVEGVAIIAIVTLNAVIATLQENRAGNALDALAKMASPQCTVLREAGQHQQVPSDALVPGDIVLLTTGDVVPADLRLLSSADCKINEMILTGESEDVRKRADSPVSKAKDGEGAKLTPENMAFASTFVSSGNATGVVVATGMRTKVGAIAALLSQGSGADGKRRNPVSRFMAQFQPKLTPLQHALHRLGVFMGTAVLAICAVVFAVGMVRGNHDPKNAERPVWLTMVMVAVSLAVSAVPEGLPMVVTICLSTGTAAMAQRHVLVRKLAAVESLGAASVICTDKTGTLTEGKMTAVKAYAGFREFVITGAGFDPTQGEILLDDAVQSSASAPILHATLLSALLCCNTTLQRDDASGQWKPFGNASEAPLVVAAAKIGLGDAVTVAAQYPRVLEIPFNSTRKMMLTVTSLPDGAPTLGSIALPPGSRFVANVKGAPNVVLTRCTQIARGSGEIASMTALDRATILDAVDELSSQALRVLAVAINPLAHLPFADGAELDDKFAAVSTPLVFLGLVASIDPARAGVPDAIATAREAGIRTVMITGDYLKTAIAIAKGISLLEVGADVEEEAVDCCVLRPRGHGEYLTEPDLDEITSRTAVFARAQPADKLEIVKSLQRQGYVTAMTGDGVNDAPALKEADIGVAMGLAGTEVAKGAADMILTDDDFCSIVEAVDKGRAIYTNIQKFVCFLLSTNFGEISIIFVAIAVGMPNPLEPLQILVLNLFADGMAAVALSLEKGDPDAMRARPRPKSQPIIHGRLWLLVAANAVLIGAGALAVFAAGLYWNFANILLDDILGGASTVDDYGSIICHRWRGIGDQWQLVANCDAVYADGSRVFPEVASGTSEFENDDIYCRGGDYECLTDGVARAQTMGFIYITTMEMFRAYTARSFTNHVFVGFCSNGYMQLAAFGSIALTLLVTNTPVVRDDLFGFAQIEWFQWLFAMAMAFACASLSEGLKRIFRRRDRERARWQTVQDGFAAVLRELRNLRHHVERLEDKLNVVTHKPARRLELPSASRPVSRANSSAINEVGSSPATSFPVPSSSPMAVV